ncbi:MAG: translation elongation factor Ts [Planctomycetes bacterium]|nr:translation elongation factor Ts [Planctomycetota bacterium]
MTEQIPAKLVKELRDITGAKMMDCKRALQEANGDVSKAQDILRKKGQADAKKRSGKSTKQGVISNYIHGNKIGVMAEMNCETDFVARNEEFHETLRDICMHIAASNPGFISRDEVPEEIIEKEKDVYKAQIKNKPENVVEKIVEGKVNSFFKDNCLLEQPFVKNDKLTVGEVITQLNAKIGENIIFSRFVRWELGGNSKDE